MTEIYQLFLLSKDNLYSLLIVTGLWSLISFICAISSHSYFRRILFFGVQWFQCLPMYIKWQRYSNCFFCWRQSYTLSLNCYWIIISNIFLCILFPIIVISDFFYLFIYFWLMVTNFLHLYQTWMRYGKCFLLLKDNPYCLLIVTPQGGHLGWVAGDEAPFGAPWTDEVVMEFLGHLEKEGTEKAEIWHPMKVDGIQQLEPSISVHTQS